MINNLYVCGDIHGMYKKFIDVFNQIKLDDNDKMVFSNNSSFFSLRSNRHSLTGLTLQLSGISPIHSI